MFQQEELVNEMEKLHKFALRLTRHAHNAEDLLQSTMLRALEKRDCFEDGTNLFSWVSKMMFNLFVSGYRKKKFETQYDPAPYIDRMFIDPPQEACVDLVTVNDNMRHLSPEHRAVLQLISADGMSYEETSAALEIPVGTVRSRLNRARSQLRAVLETPPRHPGGTAPAYAGRLPPKTTADAQEDLFHFSIAGVPAHKAAQNRVSFL